MSSVFGRAADASTMAIKHVLAEFASMHSRAVAAWEKAEAVPAADIKLFSPKASSGWHLYLAEQRALGINMAEIGSTWHDLTADEKNDYNQKAAEKADGDRLVENLRTAMPNDRTPLGLGDEKMPIREDVVQPLCQGKDIEERSKSWKRRFGKLVEESSEDIFEESIATPTCSDKYGLGYCKEKLEEDTIRRMAVMLPQLQAAAVALNDEKHLPLILVEGINPDAMERKAQAVLLRVFALLDPMVRE